MYGVSGICEGLRNVFSGTCVKRRIVFSGRSIFSILGGSCRVGVVVDMNRGVNAREEA